MRRSRAALLARIIAVLSLFVGLVAVAQPAVAITDGQRDEVHTNVGVVRFTTQDRDEQIQLIGSNWFTTAQGQELADMVATGALDLSYLITKPFPLSKVNEAISGRATDHDGGFSNYVIIP